MKNRIFLVKLFCWKTFFCKQYHDTSEMQFMNHVFAAQAPLDTNLDVQVMLECTLA